MSGPYYDRQYAGLQRIRDAYLLIGKCLEDLDWGWFDRCEVCGHPKAMHQLPRFRGDEFMPCGSQGCECHDFADGHPVTGNPVRAERRAA